MYFEERNFKVAIINTFKELKKVILTELKEDMMIMSHLLEKINEK